MIIDEFSSCDLLRHPATCRKIEMNRVLKRVHLLLDFFCAKADALLDINLRLANGGVGCDGEFFPSHTSL